MKPKASGGRGKCEEGVASSAEAREAIEGLSKADHAKLTLIARGFARGRIQGTVVEPEDLLHDAIVKTLDGRRRWNKSVSIIKHLDRVMESDAGHVAEKCVSHFSGPILDAAGEFIAQTLDPLERLAASNELEHLVELFAGDEVSLALLRLKCDGFSVSEIQRELGIGKTQYETVTKRIRRRLAKQLADGGPDHEAEQRTPNQDGTSASRHPT